ncbi:MAG TPA: ABC transporter ATP-binding protein, partial [Solirubrobacteraceae bacterium]
RVAMGRAIVRDPQAFLMDEPLSNLDAKLRIQMRSEITRIQRRLHTTTVYVTHDQTEAMTLGDRLAVMRDGVIQQLGTPAELYERPRNLFVAGFIGAPAMNFLIGEITDGTLTSPLGTIALAGSAPTDSSAHPSTDPSTRPGLAHGGHSGRVVVGVRPESFEDAAMVGERPGLVAFSAMVDVLESTGSDVYAHLSLNGAGPGAAGPGSGADPDDPVLRELAQATASEDPEVARATGSELVARVGVSHSLTEGREGRLWIDTSRIHLFDPTTGQRLSG